MVIFYSGKNTVKQAGTLIPKCETVNCYNLLGMQLNMYQGF